MKTDQTIEVLSIEESLENSPDLRMRRTRDFRIDQVPQVQSSRFMEKAPRRDEKLKEHTKRIQRELSVK